MTSSIAISGNDVYVGGKVKTGTVFSACYWKNGALVKLSDGQSNAGVLDIAVADGEIYAAGYRTNAEYSSAGFWTSSGWQACGSEAVGSYAYSIALQSQ